MLRRRRLGSATNAGNVGRVLVRFDHVVDTQPVDVDAGPRLKRSRRRLVDDLRHRVAVVRHRRVLLIDRHVLGPNLTVCKADPVRRLRTGEDHLADPQLHCGVDDVVRAERVDPERLVVRPDEDRRDRCEVNDGVVARDTGTGLQLVEAGVSGQRVEDLSGIGQVDAEVGDARVTERHQVAVDDPVSLLDEIRDRVPTRLAAATGEEDSHAADRTDGSRSCGDRWRVDARAVLTARESCRR